MKNKSNNAARASSAQAHEPTDKLYKKIQEFTDLDSLFKWHDEHKQSVQPSTQHQEKSGEKLKLQ